MKKLSVCLFSLLIMVTVFAIPNVQAKLSTTINCTGGCESYEEWSSGSNKGIGDTMTVSNPTINTTAGYWDRFLTDIQTSDGTELDIGIEKQGSGGDGYFCSAYAGNELYYFFSYGSQYKYCYLVPVTDVNNIAVFKIGYYVSGGGGMFFQIQGSSGNNGCYSGCFIPGLDTSFNTVFYIENINDNISSHEVWGIEWIQNKYDTSNGWKYVHTNPDVVSVTPPPQMYWHEYPTQDSTGGIMYSCVYNNNNNSCTIGSLSIK
jgi:hypothetical protein